MLLRARALMGAVMIVAAHATSATARAQTTAAPPQTKTPPAQAKTPPAQTKTAPAQTKAASPTPAKPASAAQTKTAPTTAKAAVPPATKAVVPPQTKAGPQAGGRGAPAAGRGAAAVTSAKGSAPVDTSAPVIIMREAFTYEGSGRRDPFLSLLTTNELRPALSDLKLNFVVYAPGGGSQANIRDNFARKPVVARVGTLFGRMRVIAIHPNAVVFSIDEFGTTRRDSLVARPDTTK